MPILLPDPAELRALAGRIDAHARATRARADRLGSQVAGTRWHGLAASTFEHQAEATVRGLRRAAGRLEDAADALRRHADNISRLIDTLTAIVRLGLGTMDELLGLPVDVLRSVTTDFGAGLTTGVEAAVHGAVSMGRGAASAVGEVTGSAFDLVGL